MSSNCLLVHTSSNKISHQNYWCAPWDFIFFYNHQLSDIFMLWDELSMLGLCLRVSVSGMVWNKGISRPQIRRRRLRRGRQTPVWAVSEALLRCSYSVNQKLRMPSPLINHNDVSAGGRARTEGWFCYSWYTPSER